MAAIPAITAGVSLVQGVASISSKNKQANAQREQIAAQSRQQAIQQATNEVVLAQNQQLAAAEYQNGVIARMQQFIQSDAALQAQQIMADTAAMQQRYAIQSGELERQQQALQQLDQLQRSATAASTAADAKRQAANTNTSAVAQQSTAQLQQVRRELDAAQRKELSLQNSGRLSSSSFSTAQQRDLNDRLATALSIGFESDSDNVKQMLQAMNEEELAGLSEQLGLTDAANTAESVGANLRILRQQSQLGLESVDASQQNNRSALSLARASNYTNSVLDAQNAANAYTAQDYAIGVQRSSGATTGADIQRQYQSAIRNTKGAGLLDYMGTAINTATPFMGSIGLRGSAPPKTTRYSGFPDVYSNAG